MAADYRYLGIGQDLFAPPPDPIDPLAPLYPAMTTNAQADAQIQDSAIASGQIDSLSASKIDTGTLNAGSYITIGDNSVRIDGTTRQITVNDGTYNVILIGKQAGGF